MNIRSDLAAEMTQTIKSRCIGAHARKHFLLEVGICSSYHIAKFFGLTIAGLRHATSTNNVNAGVRLNRRLAGDVYVDVIPLTAMKHRLALAGSGAVVDWLVVMRRLDERCMLDHAIAAKCVDERALDRLVTLLARFYQRAARVRMTGEAHLADWRRSPADNRRGLSDPRAGLVRFVDGVQERFLARCGSLLAARASGGHIVDAHGDLRPEHIWLGNPPRASSTASNSTIICAPTIRSTNLPSSLLNASGWGRVACDAQAQGGRSGEVLNGRTLCHDPPTPGHAARQRPNLSVPEDRDGPRPAG